MDQNALLNILHVGGRGRGIGLIGDFFNSIQDEAELTVFEADSTLSNAGLPELPYKIKIISKCLSNYIGKSEFNINVDQRSSSLFKVSEEALDYASPIKWGENCKTTKVITVDVTTIDELCKTNEISIPHFISLDAQGSEYYILDGAKSALSEDLVAVITEVEFREIYNKQKLFADQDIFLRNYGFKLYHFFNMQFWHSQTEYIKDDDGFPLTTEALYLRDFKYFLNKDDNLYEKLTNLARLIIIAAYFKKMSYVYQILKYIKINFNNEWRKLLLEKNCIFLDQVCSTLEKEIT